MPPAIRKTHRDFDAQAVLAIHIQELRSDRSLSQTALSLACGLGVHYIARLERGEINPSFLQLLKIADYFDLTISRLLWPIDR